MKNSQRGFTPVVIGIVIALFVLGGIGASYIASKAHENSSKCGKGTKCVDVAESDTKDWKTYRNEKYGFEIKYPVDFEEVLLPDQVYPATTIAAFHRDHLGDLGSKYSDKITIRMLTVVRPYTAENFEAAIINDVVYDGSGFHPSSIDKLEKRKLGDFEYYFTSTGRFEGRLGFAYYLASEKYGIWAFTSESEGVGDWTNPKLDVDADPTHVALKQMLAEFRFDR
jgi:hypothetical protein